jgi:hypothetical protein
VAHGQQDGGVGRADVGDQIVGRGQPPGLAELDDVARRELTAVAILARDRQAGCDQRLVAQRRGGRAVVRGVEHRARAGDRRWRSLPRQQLGDVRLVAAIVGKREPADDAVEHLDLLERERHLIEIAEDELVEGDLGVRQRLVEEDLAVPAERGFSVHARRHAIDPDVVPSLLGPAQGDERLYQRLEPPAGVALGHDQRPALRREVVGITSAVEQLFGRRQAHRRGSLSQRLAREPAGERRLMVVGVRQQELDRGQILDGHTVSGAGLVASTPLTSANSEQRATWRQSSSEPLSIDRSQTRAVLS